MENKNLVKAPVMEKNSRKISIYLPKKSYGWLSLLLAAFVFGILGYYALMAYSMTGDFGALVTLVISGGLVVDCIVMTFWFFNMRYELSSEALVMKFGPLNYSIDLSTVTEVSTKDLKHSLWPSLKLPGFSIFYSVYKDEGKVFMCATRAKKEVVIITTENGKFGITPDSEKLFLEEINNHLRELKPYKKIERIN